MDVFSFVVFSFSTRYMMRWIVAGVILVVPVLDFLSLGYLWRTAGLSMIGGIGLPTWEHKGELFREGARMVYIVVLYEALPSFLFCLGFFFFQISNFATDLVGYVATFLSVIAFICCSFFLPFAFCVFVETMDVKKAFDFEKIADSIKQVLGPYALGYGASVFCLFIAFELKRLPFIGVPLFVILSFYVLLVATYYFTRLFVKTRRSSGLTQRV